MPAKEKIILITGSTDGVGRVVARRLAAEGATVLVHGRDRPRGEAVIADIERSGGKGIFYPADFSSLQEVRALAESVTRDHGRLDCLINNAGIGTGRREDARQTSHDGHELCFAVNYLAGFLLTHLLMTALKAGERSRIVNVSSLGQQALDFDDLMLTRGYSGTRAYCQSKLAQIMFTFDLAQSLEGSGVTVNCLHPASYMNTTMVRQAGIAPTSSVDDGAAAILNLASSPQTEGRAGLFFDGFRTSRANSQACDKRARDHLRALSFKLVGLPDSAGGASDRA